MKVLFVYPRKGLFQLTQCSECSYISKCHYCDTNLTTYRKNTNSLELICHQCQSYYSYPIKCPECGALDSVSSAFGGIEELVESLQKHLQVKVKRLDRNKSKKDSNLEKALLNSAIYNAYSGEISVTTRIFDPSIPYSVFDKIIFVQAENLLASPDYLVQEDIIGGVFHLINSIDKDKTEMIFDSSVKIDILEELARNPDAGIENWYYNFLESELNNRKIFGFPPYTNMLLLTSQQNSKEKAWNMIKAAQKDLTKSISKFEGIKIIDPYPARFLKRKNKYSYHLLIKFPRKYKEFAKFRDIILQTSGVYGLQSRLNPKHLF